jgi:hypothetical protein
VTTRLARDAANVQTPILAASGRLGRVHVRRSMPYSAGSGKLDLRALAL